MEQNRYAEYCRQLISGLCNESAVVVDKKHDDMGVLLVVSGISKMDMGNVIGRKGAHIQHVRELVRVVGAMDGARVAVKITEPEGSLKAESFSNYARI